MYLLYLFDMSFLGCTFAKKKVNIVKRHGFPIMKIVCISNSNMTFSFTRVMNEEIPLPMDTQIA